MKNFLIVVCVVVVVCLLGYAGKYVNEDSVIPTNNVQTQSKQNNSTSNKNNNNSSKKEENKDDKNKEQEKEETEQNELENKKENEQENEQEKGENKEQVEDIKNNEPVIEENSISSEDKAINLAKKEYGNSTGVYYRIEQIQSNGVYIVSVRDTETTKDLAWYTVDVNKGTVK